MQRRRLRTGESCGAFDFDVFERIGRGDSFQVRGNRCRAQAVVSECRLIGDIARSFYPGTGVGMSVNHRTQARTKCDDCVLSPLRRETQVFERA